MKPRHGLLGSQVRLTPLRPGDSRALFRWINNRDLVIRSSGFRPVHPTQHAAWMKRIVEREDAVIFAIRRTRGERIIGACQLHSISHLHRSAELQIRIGEASARGRGFGAEAVRLLVQFAFRDLNLHRVWLHVLRENTVALRTYRSTGFVKEGVLRDAAFVDGRFHDLVVLSIVGNG